MGRCKQCFNPARPNIVRAAAFGVTLMLAGCSAIDAPLSAGRHGTLKQTMCSPLVEMKIKTFVGDQLRIDYSNTGQSGAIAVLGDGDPNYFINVAAYAVSNGRFVIGVKGGWESNFSTYRFEQTLKTVDGQGVSTVLEVDKDPVRLVVLPRVVADDSCATNESGPAVGSAQPKK